MVRIISGYFKGQLLKTNHNPNLRPTSDRVKESLFSILGDIENLRVVDLFAGCGNLGLEAISRGAKSCIMVEKNIRQIKLIQENVRKLELAGDVKILKMDVLRFLSDPPEADLVLVDPPYKFKYFDELFDLFVQQFSGVKIALEAGKELKIPDRISEYIQSHRIIGETSLTIMKV
ncbi:MAG: 16S rRNA (guanine(966)-N(2))-methyltransferase RsmD [Candidatus Marinimicrobia bacterium]|nr:16S rRNA (guanine(966)-N(2))-methyltransferase RsmD [Candidatus Neomarinimicrobiota bacterium]